MTTRNASATTSNGNTTSTILSIAATKLKKKIEQNVNSGYTKNGPYSVEREIDPNKKRRDGEDAKPLFEPDDISKNCRQPGSHHENYTGSYKASRSKARRSSSSDSSSPERRLKTSRNSTTSATRISSYPTAINRRTPEKIPYFLDAQREEERLLRTYGSTSVGSHKREHREDRTYKPTTSKRRQRSRSPQPSSTINYTHSRSYHQRHTGRSEAETRRKSHRSSRSLSRARERRRSSSMERSKRHYSSRRHHSRTRSYSRSHSRTRSRSRERKRGHSRNHFDHHEHANTFPIASTAPATQIITIPVPFDPFGFSGWPHHAAAWPTTNTRFPAPYHLAPMISPLSFPNAPMMRPIRPPAYGVHAYSFRPRFQPRQARGNFRPRS